MSVSESRRDAELMSGVLLTAEQARIAVDAVHWYAEDRRKVARRRDRLEGGFAVERALGDFFTECAAVERGLREIARNGGVGRV